MIKTIIISGMGTNSHKETAHAVSLAGSDVTDIAHFADVASGEADILDYQFLIFPGGFMDGDDLGAAQAAALRWKYMKTPDGIPLLNILKDFISNGGLILGICNGFQLLVKLGLLPGTDESEKFVRSVSLAHNKSAKFENRWVDLAVNPASPCIFTRNLTRLKMPVRHGEGRVAIEPEAVKDVLARNLDALVYGDEYDTEHKERDYPQNPNGSFMNIAGLTDPSGRILGLMPHPEAFHHFSNHPSWTRKIMDAPGTLLFVNAIDYIKNNAA